MVLQGRYFHARSSPKRSANASSRTLAASALVSSRRYIRQ
jgi:hypothetical protein